MSILGIKNRTENWKTAEQFAPSVRNGGVGLAKKLLANHLRIDSSEVRIKSEDVRLELFWKGMRDYLHQTRKGKDGLLNERNIQDFADRYSCLFPNLRKKIDDFQSSESIFKDLESWNYTVPEGEWKSKLGNNLYYTEIDIVLQTKNHLFIGEAKHESSFDSKSKYVLVHQLIREYVMAKILIDRITSEGCVSKKKVIPFVVADDAKKLKNNGQVKFMIERGWLKEDNLLNWNDIEDLTRDS